ncbi:Variable surface protein Vir7-like protein [Plasmodium coatneyi]|uniref:Variable surface protein Vir7-like protein n=1 Tax=Plasmodium coatneyi TaxID=208452 RepID=A0A1B1E0L6_9APIC|nr:Variable surface protein Vir7-like protein [Plasmodium coatneyi]ANQ08573.1 Variable surface protein Vir7-like protein [Plasmodium coatneyi]
MTDQNLTDLLSKKTYAEFNGEGNTYSVSCSWLENTRTALESALDECGKVKGYVDQIVKAWCILQNSGGTYASVNRNCYLFYYWLGDILINKLSDVGDSFLNIMKKIYEEFKSIPDGGIAGSENGCAIIYKDNIDKTTFSAMKAVYEYHYDHTKIKQQLQKTNKECTAAYQQHLEKIKSAYNSLNKKCPSSNNAKHCSEYRRTYKGPIEKNLSELICTLESKPGRVEVRSSQDSFQGQEQVRQEFPFASEMDSNTPAIVSSVLGVLGLPTTAFLLYKITQTIIPCIMVVDHHNNDHVVEEEGRMISLNRNKERMWLITLHNASTEEKK